MAMERRADPELRPELGLLVGAQARLEGTIAIGRLVARLDGIARDGAYERGGRARFRGFTRYPIAWEA
jgi:cytochrome P450